MEDAKIIVPVRIVVPRCHQPINRTSSANKHIISVDKLPSTPIESKSVDHCDDHSTSETCLPSDAAQQQGIVLSIDFITFLL